MSTEKSVDTSRRTTLEMRNAHLHELPLDYQMNIALPASYLKRKRNLGLLLIGVVLCFNSDTPAFQSVEAEAGASSITPIDPSETFHPTHLIEARGRARLLHETIHGVLQVVHRDFFIADESRSIPSHSLEDVFKEIAVSYDVQIRWLAVNARAMNVDNEPKTDFERKAVKALAQGAEQYEEASATSFQYAGSIRLASQCLKCHLPARSNNDARTAGLVITMPLKPE